MAQANVDYPDGTGANLPYYPSAPGCTVTPSVFTSTYNVAAKGDLVRNSTMRVPGPEDAVGYVNFGISSVEDTICYVCPLSSFPPYPPKNLAH